MSGARRYAELRSPAPLPRLRLRPLALAKSAGRQTPPPACGGGKGARNERAREGVRSIAVKRPRQTTPSNDPMRIRKRAAGCLRGSEAAKFRIFGRSAGGGAAPTRKRRFSTPSDPLQKIRRESDAPSEILRSAGADPVRLHPDGARLTASRRGSRLRRQGFGRGAPPSPAYHNPP